MTTMLNMYHVNACDVGRVQKRLYLYFDIQSFRESFRISLNYRYSLFKYIYYSIHKLILNHFF